MPAALLTSLALGQMVASGGDFLTRNGFATLVRPTCPCFPRRRRHHTSRDSLGRTARRGDSLGGTAMARDSLGRTALIHGIIADVRA